MHLGVLLNLTVYHTRHQLEGETVLFSRYYHLRHFYLSCRRRVALFGSFGHKINGSVENIFFCSWLTCHVDLELRDPLTLHPHAVLGILVSVESLVRERKRLVVTITLPNTVARIEEERHFSGAAPRDHALIRLEVEGALRAAALVRRYTQSDELFVCFRCWRGVGPFLGEGVPDEEV